jgi:hypothetical protein
MRNDYTPAHLMQDIHRQVGMAPVTELLDGAPDLNAWEGDDAPAARAQLAVVPKRSLRDHVEGIDLIIETIEALEDDGELTDETRDQLSAMLVTELAGTRRKVDNVNGALATWESLDAAAAKEIERLQKRRSRFARLTERLELHVLALLEASKLPAIEGNISTLARKKNPPSVQIADAAAVPADYLRTPPAPKPVPDKTLIKSALQAGAEIPGCTLAAGYRLVRS